MDDVLDVRRMAELRMLFEKQLNALASELGHKIAQVELDLMIEKLGHFGLRRLSEACLILREQAVPNGQFPTIAEFEDVIHSFGLVR